MALFLRRQACPLIAICAITLLLCSCAAPRLAPALTSAPIPFNADAGQGNWINVTLHLQSGRQISPVEVDTGWPYKTIFDKSQEPLLGKRLGKALLYTPFAGLKIVDVYAAPKLYLGHEPLRMSSRVYAFDLQKLAPGLKGILGMDCLRHYCVQFDFSRHQMAFLSPQAPAGGALGGAIPLTIIDDLVVARADCFGAGRILFCPDTGCQQCDAMLRAKWLRQLQNKDKLSWSTFFDGPGNRAIKVAGLSEGKIEGNTYNDLTVAQWDGAWPGGNLLGLPFLARNLVTFDFPERKLYLKQESPGPRNPALFAAEEAGKYLIELKKDGRLPGWATNDVGEGSAPNAPKCITHYPISLTFDFRKEIVPGWVDVTATVKSLLASGARDIRAGNALAGFDPAPNHSKDLRMVLRGPKQNRLIQTAQGRTLTVPPGADVIRAQYGFLSGPAFMPARDDASFYHFVMVKKAPDDPWRLTRAWQSDVEGRLIKNYSAQ